MERRHPDPDGGYSPGAQSHPCAGYIGHPFETIGMVCMMDHVCLPKHVRCEYNEREPFCFARNVCRGSVNFLVCALMGCPDERAPPPLPSGLFATEKGKQALPFSWR